MVYYASWYIVQNVILRNLKSIFFPKYRSYITCTSFLESFRHVTTVLHNTRTLGKQRIMLQTNDNSFDVSLIWASGGILYSSTVATAL